MPNGSSPNLEEIFAAALERPPAERSEFVEEACHGDRALEVELGELLDAHDGARIFFDELSEDIAKRAALELESALHQELRIGPYRTLELIGHGGMGAVYRAIRVDGEFDQQVAVKLIHLDMETPEVRARFLAERQLLARLSHPHIARLQDGGVTAEGRPYFVMEYIEGLPITRDCEARELGVEETLRVFLQVIEAVSYLHLNLVVHRDLKPSNILVDTSGEVKLVDFGIAKLLADQAEAEAATRTALRRLTRQYAAPEQLSGSTITTATDVYSLGVVLYELLTGVLPHDRAGADGRELSHEVPTSPSAVSRRPRDGARVAFDLDNICLMALREEPHRRYPSAEQLGQDIERFLSGLPVVARRSTVGYRLSKLVRRRKGAIVVGTGLLGGLTLSFLRERNLRRIAEEAQSRAQEEGSKAIAVSGFLGNLLSSVDPEKARGHEVTVSEVLEQAVERIESDDSLLRQPAVEATVRTTLGTTYRSLGKPVEARPHLERALALQRDLLGEEHPDTVSAMAELAAMAYLDASYDEAEALQSRVLELRVQSFGEDHAETLKAINQLASVYWAVGRYGEAEPLDRRTLESRERLLGEDHPETLSSLNALAVTLFSMERYEDAAEMFDRAYRAFEARSGADSPDALRSRHNLAASFSELGRWDEAESLLVDILELRLRVLGEEHEDTAQTLHNLGLPWRDRAGIRRRSPSI